MVRSAKPTKSDGVFSVHLGDARRFGDVFDDATVGTDAPITLTITSPPYHNLINYGQQENQIGFGQSYQAYLEDCRQIFEQIFARTERCGSLWLVADTLLDRTQSPSRLRNVPFDLADQCEQVGWTLRDVIVWHKDKARPWSQPGRMRNTFEYILYFVKSPDFKYYVDRIREPEDLASWWVKYPERYNPRGRAPGNVWKFPIPSQGSWANSSVRHSCPLPPLLIDRIVKLASDPGDIVCDPFAGSGTVVAVAERLGRRGFGTELNPEYVQAFHDHVRTDLAAPNHGSEIDSLERKSSNLAIAINKLRALKLARVAWASLRKQNPELALPTHIIALAAEPVARNTVHHMQDVSLTFVSDVASADLGELQRALKEIVARPPLTKYGIAGDVRVLSRDDVVAEMSLAGHAEFSVYLHGHTWKSSGVRALKDFLDLGISHHRMGYPPIASNLHVELLPTAESGGVS